MTQSVGPIILDVLGTELTPEEREILQHPLVGGVILFSRNYHDIPQLTRLCQSIRQSRKTPLLITVDHEGGRVQRFRDGFTPLPSMRTLGHLYTNDSAEAIKFSEICGWLMAAELLSVGIDLSFAPVLDMDKGLNPAIGDRAFHSHTDVIVELAKAVIHGMKKAGMAATGKHFPGHGSVNIDSHKATPIDSRKLEQITADDMQTFIRLMHTDLSALMPAHIIFPEVDDKPVGFSKIWLQNILRKELNYQGIIFSDDLNMEGASAAGNYPDRALAALDAGCDMILICNNRLGATAMLDQLPHSLTVNVEKFKRLQGQFLCNYSTLQQTSMWKECNDYVRRRVGHESIK